MPFLISLCVTNPISSLGVPIKQPFAFAPIPGSVGSLTRSAGNACQPSRVAPAWAWRWVSDSCRGPSLPPCPSAPPFPAWGSPNPRCGCRGAPAPGPRARVAACSLHTRQRAAEALSAGSEVSLADIASPALIWIWPQAADSPRPDEVMAE